MFKFKCIMLNQYIVWRKKNALIRKCLDDWIDLEFGKGFACWKKIKNKKNKWRGIKLKREKKGEKHKREWKWQIE